MTPEDVRLLFAYDAWANARTLEACAALTPEQFTRSLGSSFGSVRDTLAHILGAQWIWHERLNGRPTAGLPSADAYPDLASLGMRWAEVERDLLGFVGTLVAVPLAAAIGVIVRFAVQVYLDSSVYKGGGEVTNDPGASLDSDNTRLAKDKV